MMVRKHPVTFAMHRLGRNCSDAKPVALASRPLHLARSIAAPDHMFPAVCRFCGIRVHLLPICLQVYEWNFFQYFISRIYGTVTVGTYLYSDRPYFRFEAQYARHTSDCIMYLLLLLVLVASTVSSQENPDPFEGLLDIHEREAAEITFPGCRLCGWSMNCTRLCAAAGEECEGVAEDGEDRQVGGGILPLDLYACV